MEATEINMQIVDSIISTLAKEKCTVEQAQSILSYTQRKIMAETTVQISKENA